MRHSQSLIGFIESAIDQDPFCACGAGMTVVEHDGALWLECVRHDDRPHGLASRIWSLFGHDRRLLLAAEEAA
jgi:hypothetical protein